MNINYSPLLKARDAEIKVLRTSRHNTNVTPIFELQRAARPSFDPADGPGPRAKSSATDASYFIDDIARQWNRPMYIDIHRVANHAERQQWWQLLSTLMEVGGTKLPMAPVIHLGDNAASIAAAGSLVANADKAAVRLRLPHPNLATLADEILSVATLLQIDPKNLTVILDWEDRLEQHGLDDLEAGTQAAIAAASAQPREIITLGTPDCTDCKQMGDWNFPRLEWWLWLRLAQHHDNLTYGDYALFAPADPAKASPQYGHLRYSYDDTLWVHRRSKPVKSSTNPGGLKGAFQLCCEYLVQSTHFSGAEFSNADTTISGIAAGATPPMGAPGQWREIAFDHHLATVSAQLGTPASPPEAGTL
ncbi:MAG: beta family protein [Mycobacterium sp.]